MTCKSEKEKCRAILLYNRPLTDKEISDYDLAYIPVLDWRRKE